MARLRMQLSTGIPGLDRLLRGLMPGDNVVWQIDCIEGYRPFVKPYAEYAREHHQRVIYFRFADHEPLLTKADGAEVYELHPERGFEPFLGEVHKVIDSAKRGRFYLFDCLSQLAPDWKSDRMLGNFFMLTCPYLYDRAAIAYFALLRNHHSFHALTPIANTTQILVNVYRQNNKLYVHPVKVQHRHSGTMYTLHVREGDDFIPVTQSGIITEILGNIPWSRLDAASYMLGYWSRTFAEAEEIAEEHRRGLEVGEKRSEYFRKILHMLISTEEKVLRLAERYLTLEDLLDIRRRMIGTGLIGGKSVGMLLARAILRKDSPESNRLLEQHDSFYVGSDVFYTYLVQNGYWWMVKQDRQSFLVDESCETARRRILTGDFPDYIVKQFADMLEYFGQSPIIVRSSSLLEDNFGNAFAGKYESVFCANQGGPHKRLEDFLSAVRAVYASTMSEEALLYRQKRNLLDKEEQMGLLIQRVSGATYGTLFFPQAAGVGFSFNPYVWHKNIDPEAGMIRLVFGVGTRAVDRSDDDYTRIVALNDPLRRPEGSLDEVREYAQRRVDVLDLEANHLTSMSFEDILNRRLNFPLEMFASRDRKLERQLAGQQASEGLSWVLTFEKLLTETSFVPSMRQMLKILHDAYQYPVDMEFTLNFINSQEFQINIVQCRPLQIAAVGQAAELPGEVPPENLLLKSSGSIIGQSIETDLDSIIYIVPERYSALTDAKRHAVARIVGDLTHHHELRDGTMMLIGPGRWGTTTPSLGVPVSFADINTASVLCEVVAMHESLVPDVSLGTHFFNELVENDMLYLAYFPKLEGNTLQSSFFEDGAHNCFANLLPEERLFEDIIRVIRLDKLSTVSRIRLAANTIKQRVVCYLETTASLMC